MTQQNRAFTEWHDHCGPVLLVLLEDDGHLAVFGGDCVQLGAVAVKDEVAQLHQLVVQGHPHGRVL